MATNAAMLDKLGLSLALIMGAAVLLADWRVGQFLFFPIFLVFLIASVTVTRFGYSKKREMGLYEHERSWENVLANGLVPTLAAAAAGLIGPGAYIGSLAAITAGMVGAERALSQRRAADRAAGAETAAPSPASLTGRDGVAPIGFLLAAWYFYKTYAI